MRKIEGQEQDLQDLDRKLQTQEGAYDIAEGSRQRLEAENKTLFVASEEYRDKSQALEHELERVKRVLEITRGDLKNNIENFEDSVGKITEFDEERKTLLMEVAALKDNMSILDIKIVDLQLVVDSRTE